MIKVLFIDNYDSFSDIIIYYLKNHCSVDKIKNDDLSKFDCLSDYNAVFLSPGPGDLNDIGFISKYFEKAFGVIPIFGICLGFQYICSMYNGSLKELDKPLHGIIRKVLINDSVLLKGISELDVVFYNSLYVDSCNMEKKFIKGYEYETKIPVIFEDREKKVFATQFHPEAYCSKGKKLIFDNFFNMIRGEYR